nr:MAG TPA: cysteine-rich protein [Caudoviricetes sp.]
MLEQEKHYWYRCPVCGKKMLYLREDTVIKSFPGYCKLCKSNFLLNIEPSKEPECQTVKL